MGGYLVQGIGFLGAGLFIFSYQLRSSRALFFGWKNLAQEPES